MKLNEKSKCCKFPGLCKLFCIGKLGRIRTVLAMTKSVIEMKE